MQLNIKELIKKGILYASSFALMFIAGIIIYTAHINKVMATQKYYYQYGYEEGYDKGKISGLSEVKISYQQVLEELERYHRLSQNTAENYIFTTQRLERIMNRSNSSLSEKKKEQYKKSIIKWAYEYNLSPVFVASIIHRETNFRENAVSSAGAKGCMQVMPKIHKDKLKKLGITEKDLSNIDYGVNIGCQIIKEYLETANWDYRKALFRYVGAVNNVEHAQQYVDDIFEMTIYAYSSEEKSENSEKSS